jgi:hypothetical protein
MLYVHSASFYVHDLASGGHSVKPERRRQKSVIVQRIAEPGESVLIPSPDDAS